MELTLEERVESVVREHVDVVAYDPAWPAVFAEEKRETKSRVAPVLEAQGYDYFWRPTSGDDIPPFYAWFIKRGSDGRRTHHIHMVEPAFEHWERLLFRDYLIEFPDVAREYQTLKLSLAGVHKDDRIAYTNGKADFIERVTRQAREYYKKGVRKA